VLDDGKVVGLYLGTGLSRFVAGATVVMVDHRRPAW
jgi:hypothetical protein